MLMSFGQYKGKHVGWVIVEDFQYFLWMRDNNMSNKKEYQKMLEYVQIIDNKPFLCQCHGSCEPKNPVSKFSIYRGDSSPVYFCNTCDPYELGAINGKLNIGRTINDIIYTSSDINMTIKNYTSKKGMPQRKTESALDNYFSIT